MNPNSSQAALAQLKLQQAQTQNPNDILANQRQQLGVEGAQETVTGLRGAINNTTKLLKQVAPSVMGRTGSSLVTNAQATKQISNEQQPLYETLGEQGSQYGEANTNLSELQRRASEAAQGIYAGQQDKQSYLQNLYNTLFQREQTAEDRRRAELDRREQIRQFNEQLKASRAASAAANRSFDLGGGSSKSSEPTIKDQAYASVQNFLQGNDDEIRSDFNATLKSANYGNKLDKLKIELYKQSRPDLFSNSTMKVSTASPNKNISGVVYGSNTTSTKPKKSKIKVVNR